MTIYFCVHPQYTVHLCTFGALVTSLLLSTHLLYVLQSTFLFAPCLIVVQWAYKAEFYCLIAVIKTWSTLETWKILLQSEGTIDIQIDRIETIFAIKSVLLKHREPGLKWEVHGLFLLLYVYYCFGNHNFSKKLYNYVVFTLSNQSKWNS